MTFGEGKGGSVPEVMVLSRQGNAINLKRLYDGIGHGGEFL